MRFAGLEAVLNKADGLRHRLMPSGSTATDRHSSSLAIATPPRL